jgi:hypothetical protein
MSPAKKKSEYKSSSNNNGSIPELMKELRQAALIGLASSTNNG